MASSTEAGPALEKSGKHCLQQGWLGVPLARTICRLAAIALAVEDEAPEQVVSTPWGRMAP